jgi:hypothetical protein
MSFENTYSSFEKSEYEIIGENVLYISINDVYIMQI